MEKRSKTILWQKILFVPFRQLILSITIPCKTEGDKSFNVYNPHAASVNDKTCMNKNIRYGHNTA